MNWHLMSLLASEAIDNLLAVGQRSLLALIGIVIGTAAVIAMVNVGHNASVESLRQFAAMGTDMIVAQNGAMAEGGGLGLPPTTLDDLPKALSSISIAAPFSPVGTRLGRGEGIQAMIIGATPSLKEAARLRLAEGRFLTSFDRQEIFAVIGQKVANARAISAHSLHPGDQLRGENYVFTVIGVLEETALNPLIPFDVNEAVIVPFGAMRRVTPTAEPSAVLARAAAGTDPIAVAEALSQRLQDMRHGKAVQVQSARQLIEGMEQQSRLFTLLLAAIGAISLVVGGVGVMNVMLMNVAERRREIGLRMAIGARRSHIRAMFLFEAAALSLVGGLLGTILGIMGAAVFAWFSGWQFTMAAAALPLGGMISAGIGLFFGAYPASTAAALNPIETLRAE